MGGALVGVATSVGVDEVEGREEVLEGTLLVDKSEGVPDGLESWLAVSCAEVVGSEVVSEEPAAEVTDADADVTEATPVLEAEREVDDPEGKVGGAAPAPMAPRSICLFPALPIVSEISNALFFNIRLRTT